MREPRRKTVRLPDGFNGDTVLCYADPIAVEGNMVKLQCAEPAKGHLIRWAERVNGEIVGASQHKPLEPKVRLRDLLRAHMPATVD